MSDAQKAEALGTTVTVEYAGEQYTVDPNALTLDTIEADEDGRYLAVVRALLGPEQYAAYKAKHPLANELVAFRAALVAAMGNSEASPGS